MPGGDRRGPMDMGPMTGWGTGYCAGSNRPGCFNSVHGRNLTKVARCRGYFRGETGRRGWRNYDTGGPGRMRFGPYGSSMIGSDMPDEKEILKRCSELLQAELSAIQKRLDDMEESAV